MSGKRVALVLGSGGARGYTHIGVIDELLARGYQIDCIAGCSMGALIGGIYAAGKLDDYRQWVEGLDYLDVLRLLDLGSRLGAIRGEKVFGRIREMLGEVNIEDLPIAYTAVATDLTNQQEIWFQEGCLHQAMRASAAIPSLFTPAQQGSRMLVDGGLLNPLPIVPVVSSHCDLIIAVNLNAGHNPGYHLPAVERPPQLKERAAQLRHSLSTRLPFRDREEKTPPTLPDKADKVVNGNGNFAPSTLLELVGQSFEVMQNSLAHYKVAGYPPDVLINVPRTLCRFFEFHKAPEIIKLGRQIARDSLSRFECGISP
ncbi:alpha/beta hydrolase [Ventosimonas gracilis]|uniref:Alpha/beta hydrolase n=1 Tax=Ventosimonas gracilis TaxID=1680762 RepID=A0A139SRT9_9GAMM|nr:patatin-like phospholipase family protein [Ventosimonas gracilis]KXU37268.1 alpha/beta hydrolase [Ventosimonas gracilis]